MHLINFIPESKVSTDFDNIMQSGSEFHILIMRLEKLIHFMYVFIFHFLCTFVRYILHFHNKLNNDHHEQMRYVIY